MPRLVESHMAIAVSGGQWVPYSLYLVPTKNKTRRPVSVFSHAYAFVLEYSTAFKHSTWPCKPARETCSVNVVSFPRMPYYPMNHHQRHFGIYRMKRPLSPPADAITVTRSHSSWFRHNTRHHAPTLPRSQSFTSLSVNAAAACDAARRGTNERSTTTLAVDERVVDKQQYNEGTYERKKTSEGSVAARGVGVRSRR